MKAINEIDVNSLKLGDEICSFNDGYVEYYTFFDGSSK